MDQKGERNITMTCGSHSVVSTKCNIGFWRSSYRPGLKEWALPVVGTPVMFCYYISVLL